MRAPGRAFYLGVAGAVCSGVILSVYNSVLGDNLALTPLWLSVIAYTAWHGRRIDTLLVIGACVTSLAFVNLQFAPSRRSFIAFMTSQFVTDMMVGFLVYTLRHSQRTEWQRARIDGLTQLWNWLGFSERTQIELQRVKRYPKPLSVLYLDVDDFKRVNDTNGHAAGDRVLQALAKAIQSTIRESDIAARIGGDEFAILMPETDENGAQALSKRIMEQVSMATMVTCSVGSATFERPPTDVEALLHTVDQLMYRAKTSGKARIVSASGPELSLG